MLKIKGRVKRIKRIKMLAPNDGIHTNTRRGYIFGTRALYVGDKFVPYGKFGFYWQLNEDEGVKVYYSIKARKPTKSEEHVRRYFDRMRKKYEDGISNKPIEIIQVKVKLWKSKIAWGLVQRHVHYPKKAIKQLAKGYPYDFNCLDQREHPDHNAKGFRAFMDKVGRKLKIGDAVYCTKRKKWYVVDISAANPA